MTTERRSVVLASSLAPAAGVLRGHRSLGDENLTLAGTSGKRQGFIQDRTNINSRGWNTSTRASPLWKRKVQENKDKENSKLPVPKKFQHVQSKLAAPVFSQRRSKQADTGEKTGAAFAEGPLHDSPGFLNVPATPPPANLVCGEAGDPQGPTGLFPADQFVTKRCGNQLPDDFPFAEPELLESPSTSFSSRASIQRIVDNSSEQQEAAEPGDHLLASPMPRASPHPSVSALYQFAQEIRTPLSCTMSPAASGTSVYCVRLAALESAAQAFEPEASPGELTDSFGAWLMTMGMEEEALPSAALGKMRALWQKAKEAVQLHALVEQLKEEELQLAQQQADESARHFDSLLAENKDLAGQKMCLQQRLLEAEERLGRVASSQMPVDDVEATRGAKATSTCEPDSLPQHTVPENCQPSSPIASMDAAAAAQVDSPVGSTASVALWGQESNKGSDHSSGSPMETRFMAGAEVCAQHDGFLQGVAGLQLGADSSSSISLGSQVHPCFSSSSAAFGQMLIGEPLQSPSSCASFAGATVGGVPAETPGLSVVSCMPEAVPFTTWLAGVDDAASPATSAGAEVEWPAAAPDGVMPSPPAVLSSLATVSEARSEALSSQRSAGLSVLSRPAQPVAFTAWATFADKVEPTPSGPTEAGMVHQGDSPAPSLGLRSSAPLGADAHTAPQMSTPMWPGLGAAAPAGLPSMRPSDGIPMDMSPALDHLAAAASPTPFGMASVGDSRAPNFNTTPGRHGFHGSPQLSAGLSIVADTPQAVAFGVWKSVQQARKAHAVAASMQDSPSPSPYGPVSPLSSVGFETVSKPEDPSSWRNGGDTPLGEAADRTAHASPAAHVRCNPLFELDSPASSMSALPERADALGGLAATPSPARSQPAAPSLASTPMSDFSHGRRSNLTSPLGGEIAGSPSVHLYGGCSPGLFGTNRFGDVDVMSPETSVSLTATDTAAQAAYAREVSVAAVAGDPGPTLDQSPVQREVSFVDADVDSPSDEVPCLPSPGDALECSPSCATRPEDATGATTAALENSCDAGILSPKNMNSPAANSVITTKFIASPGADSRVRDDLGLDAKPVLETTDGSQAVTSTDVEDLQRPDDVAEHNVRAAAHAVAALWDHGSPEAAVTAQAPALSSCSDVTLDELAAAAGGEGASHSYPNTPSAAWPASPTSSVYATPLEAFATPTSLASLCSAIRLTAMRMRGEVSTPDGHGPLPSSATPSNFSFGLSHMQPAGLGGHQEARTPVLMGLGMQADTNAITAAPGFGSPMPLMQLTPVQLRALDQLAGHVIAALSPAHKPVPLWDLSSSPVQPTAVQGQPASNDDPQPTSAAAAVAFNMAQLLSQLRSPLPAPMHNRSRFAPGPEQAAAAHAGAQDAVVKQPHDELGGLSVAVEVAAEPAGVNDAAPGPAPSPLPNFSRLMAFLNAGPTGAAAISMDSHVGGANASGSQEEPATGVASGNNVGESRTAAAAAFSLAQLLAQLHSPMPNHAAARSADFGVDSPAAAGGVHDSPASEAASFGFSTAAKIVPPRITPGTTPGGAGVSFMRWAQDTGPPSFRLESDARHVRGRGASRTPPTPMSFSFGGQFGALPMGDDTTPAVGHGLRKDDQFDHRPSPPKLLNLQLSPVAPDSGQSPFTKGNARHVRSVAASPEGVVLTPGVSSSFDPAVASPVFSFGQQLGGLPAGAVTPTGPFGPGVAHEMEAAQSAVRYSVPNRGSNMPRQRSSPALSLGAWGSVPLGAVNGSQTPSERGFTFDNLAASLMATPVWPGLYGGASMAELTAASPKAEFVRDIGAALEQFAVAASPTLFGMAVHGSPEDTPGVTQRVSARVQYGDSVASPHADVCVPATAVLWTALLAGALHSPMPAAVHARAQRWPSQAQPIAPSAVTVAALLNTFPSAGSADASSTGFAPGAKAPPARAAVGAEAERGAEAEVGETAPRAAAGLSTEAPPPYEDLPDLIARGLCLSASTPAQSPEADSVAGIVINTGSSIGENPTPLVCRTEAPDAAQSSDAGSPPGRLFQPARPLAAAGSFALDDSPPVLDQLVVESICSSNGSYTAGALNAAEQTGCTTEPVPTPSRLAGPEPASACSAIPNADEDSVHSSPVFSFHVASECTSSPDSLMPVAGAATVCTETANPAVDDIELTSACADSSGIVSRPGNGCAARCSSPVVTECSQPEGSPAFSADAVPRLLFGAGALSTAMVDPKSADAASSAAGPQDALAFVAQAAAGLTGSAQMAEASFTAAVLQAAAPAFMMSPTPSRGRACDGPDSPLTFSYLGTGTPGPTPPTAELASTGKGGAMVGHPRASPRSSGGGCQFWAPSPSGPSAASGDRVTLEASNRRIRANADLLLDFQGSPAHGAPTVPADSGSGAVTPRMKGHGVSARPGAPHISPAGKNWELALSPRNQHLTALTQVSSAATMIAHPTSDEAVKPVVSEPKEASAAAPAAGRNPMERAQAVSHNLALQPGQGPRLQQLVATGIEHALASATAAVVPYSSMPAANMTISQRLGLWPAPAWGIPCSAPAAAAVGLPVSTGPGPSAKPEPALLLPAAIPQQASGKPVLTSRDVQTTPGLVKTQSDSEYKASNASQAATSITGGSVLPPRLSIQLVGHVAEGGPNAARKPAFRSRIPGLPQPRLPVPPAAAASSGGPQVSDASTTVSSEGEEHNGEMTSAERVVRRRRLLTCAAAAGGPQRVLVKRSGHQRSVTQEAGELAMLGDEEMRRRAQIMGMRISPYLRTKPGRVRLPEAPKGSKGG